MVPIRIVAAVNMIMFSWRPFSHPYRDVLISRSNGSTDVHCFGCCSVDVS